jgi:hypothetical protein
VIETIDPNGKHRVTASHTVVVNVRMATRMTTT